MNRFLFFILLFFISLSTNAQVGNHTFKASKATGGIGLHTSKIWWINWDINSNNKADDVLSGGISGQYKSPSGYIYTIKLEMINNNKDRIVSSTTTDYGLNSFPNGYTSFSPASNILAIKNSANGALANFRLTISSKDPYGNISIPKGFVIAGSESLSGSGEHYTLDISKNTGGQLRVIDKYIVNNDWKNYNVDVVATNSGRTIKATQASGGDNGRGDVMLFAEGVGFIDVELKGAGYQHIALGFMEDVDYSDAPKDYGLAWHLINSSFTGGTFPDETTKVNTTSNLDDISLLTGQLAKPVPPQLFLGDIVDADYLAPEYPDFGGAPELDDNHNEDDEDALPEGLKLFQTDQGAQILDIPVFNNTGKDAYLYMWIDTNNDGQFSLNERFEEIILSSASKQTKSFDIKKFNLQGGIYYVRLRISSQKDLLPTGFAPDGEVEDHMIGMIQIPFNIMGTVFFDEDGGMPNGRPIKNLKIELLLKADNSVFRTTTTTPWGSYIFTNVPEGKYIVRVTPPNSKFVHVSSTDTTPFDGETDVEIDRSGNKLGINFGLYNKICQKPANTSGPGLPTNHGITALRTIDRGKTNWPQIRTGAWTALESRNTGFVINRVAANHEGFGGQIPSITDPKKGMMVYDTTNNCLKIYTGTSWKCFTTFSCPD